MPLIERALPPQPQPAHTRVSRQPTIAGDANTRSATCSILPGSAEEYLLTDSGQAITPVLRALRTWGEHFATTER
jgi:hypothetical protein